MTLEQIGILISQIVAPIGAVFVFWVGVRQWTFSRKVELEQTIISSLGRVIKLSESMGLEKVGDEVVDDAGRTIRSASSNILKKLVDDDELSTKDLRLFAKRAMHMEALAVKTQAKLLRTLVQS